MTRVVVVDASVVVKWFLPEVHAEAARRLLRGRRTLVAPELIWAEIGNTLWKKYIRKELTADAAYAILQDMQRFPLQTIAINVLLDMAWNLAVRFQISVYDALYLALAMSRHCTLVTADHQLFTVLKRSPLATALLWVEDIS